MVHVRMSGKAPAACRARIASDEAGKPEVRCMAMSTFLCDWPVGDGTCDMPLCGDHAHLVGRNRHLCPQHVAQQQRDEPGLF